MEAQVCEEDIDKLVCEYGEILRKREPSQKEKDRLQEISEVVRLPHYEILERINKKRKNPV